MPQKVTGHVSTPVFLLLAMLLISACGGHEENPFSDDITMGTTLHTLVLIERGEARTWPQKLRKPELQSKELMEAVCSGHLECFAGPDDDPLSLIVIVHHANETPVNLLIDSDKWRKASDEEIKSLLTSTGKKRLDLCPKK